MVLCEARVNAPFTKMVARPGGTAVGQVSVSAARVIARHSPTTGGGHELAHFIVPQEAGFYNLRHKQATIPVNSGPGGARSPSATARLLLGVGCGLTPEQAD